MTLLQWSLAAIAAACAVALVTAAARDPRESRRAAFVALAVFAGTLVVRLLLVRPSFLHANFHGVALVDAVLDFPRESSHRSTYGQFGFLALGAVAAIFGRTFEAVCAINQATAALTVVAIARLAGRYTGRGLASAVAVAVCVLHPALARVAASEDAHNLAVLVGCVALVAIDSYAASGARAWLVAATAALVLMINTRQTLYLFVPAAFVLAIARGGVALLRRPEVIASIAVVVAALAIRIAATASDPSEQVTLRALAVVLSSPSMIVSLVRFHPLFDIARFGPIVPALLLVGLWRCFVARGVSRALAFAFALVFAVTLPFGLPTPGVEMSFRLPAIALGAIVAAVGGAWVLEKIGRVGSRVALVVVALVPLATPAWRAARAVSAETEEYRFVRDAAGALAHDIVLARLPVHEPMPSYSPPRSALAARGVNASVVDTDRLGPRDFDKPVVFVAGVQCFAWSLGETAGFDPHGPGFPSPELLRRLTPILFGRALESPLLVAPRGMRPECTALLAGASPIGPRGEIAHPPQDVPFVLYREDPIPLQLYALAPR
jgi:hypothetical protein